MDKKDMCNQIRGPPGLLIYHDDAQAKLLNN
jgi:hypothetical protein